MAEFPKVRHVNMDAIDNGVMVRWTEIVKAPDKGVFDDPNRHSHELAFVGDQVDAGFEKFKELMKVEMVQIASRKVDSAVISTPTVELKVS